MDVFQSLLIKLVEINALVFNISFQEPFEKKLDQVLDWHGELPLKKIHHLANLLLY